MSAIGKTHVDLMAIQ
uniref:Uncharacterized protein n=1 Tax=Nymphaea colorata TaxID=210225 RepID=A0A5K1E450_9MAGN